MCIKFLLDRTNQTAVLNSGYHQLTTGEKKIDAVFWEINGIEKTLKELRYNVQYKRIIVDIQTDQITYFLDVAARMGILTSYHHYMFTSLVHRLFYLMPVLLEIILW